MVFNVFHVVTQRCGYGCSTDLACTQDDLWEGLTSVSQQFNQIHLIWFIAVTVFSVLVTELIGICPLASLVCLEVNRLCIVLYIDLYRVPSSVNRRGFHVTVTWTCLSLFIQGPSTPARVPSAELTHRTCSNVFNWTSLYRVFNPPPTRLTRKRTVGLWVKGLVWFCASLCGNNRVFYNSHLIRQIQQKEILKFLQNSAGIEPRSLV